MLLGHKDGSVTTHYSAPDVANLIEASNRVAATEGRNGHGMGDRLAFLYDVKASRKRGLLVVRALELTVSMVAMYSEGGMRGTS